MENGMEVRKGDETRQYVSGYERESAIESEREMRASEGITTENEQVEGETGWKVMRKRARKTYADIARMEDRRREREER
ncbi:MAG: hypothetical protein KTM48_01475 [Wolbachia endosymbiont of Pissodes strobi]|nr:hypothetical protein [Wolbachia endosymbiont of Pissodes strobi]